MSHFPLTPEEHAAEIERLACEVNRDMPGATIGARLREAMKRCRGRDDPARVRAALERT